MADKKSNKMLNIKRKRIKSRLTLTHPENIKLISSHKFSVQPEEISHEEDFLENEIEEGRQENSLSQLTKKVMQYIKNKQKLNININELVKDLCVKKRRIYDITNVLQGMGYIEKKGKNKIIWIKNQIFNKRDIKIKNNTIKLYKQINELNDSINKTKEELISISKKNDFNKYGYITFNDLKNLSINEKLDFLILKGNKGTKVEIMDKKSSRKTCEEILKQFLDGKIELKQKNYKKINLIKNENHIFLESNDRNSIKVYRINNGELNEIIKDNQKGMYFFVNKDINTKKENNINNNIKDNKNNFDLNIIGNINNKNINNDLPQPSLLLENKEKRFDDLGDVGMQKSSFNLNCKERFSIYEFLKWNGNNSYMEKYNDIKNKYYGISSLFRKI